jgi:CBS-domain-containing membrane protein
MPVPLASDVALRHPKTMGTDASVADARAALTDLHVHMVLITRETRLLGTLIRDDLPAEAANAEPALRYAVLDDRTISPDTPVADAHALLRERGWRRLAVVDDTGHLLGLLCLKRRLNGFCTDAGVAARTAGPGSLL